MTPDIGPQGVATLISNGRLRGDQITFSAGDVQYTGRVNNDTIEGTVTSGGRTTNWQASRIRR